MNTKDREIIRKGGSNLVQVISQAENNIKIFSGEGRYIYNSSKVQMAIYEKKQKNREFDISVSVGPCLYGEVRVRGDKLVRVNGLIELAKENLIKLYVRDTRTDKPHFYVADDGKTGLYVIEKYHPCLTPFSKKEIEYLSKEKSLLEELEERCKEFDRQIKEEKWSLWCKENSEDKLLILTELEFKLLMNYVKARKLNYDKLHRDKIKEILLSLTK